MAMKIDKGSETFIVVLMAEDESNQSHAHVGCLLVKWTDVDRFWVQKFFDIFHHVHPQTYAGHSRLAMRWIRNSFVVCWLPSDADASWSTELVGLRRWRLCYMGETG